uniref:Uncharacterized protein n=1 Tax=Timema cristinae TaxID=61476 RepID=A0A7R9GUF1_TIMCR|nr:unnamed protein product [Timema cristinae]
MTGRSQPVRISGECTEGEPVKYDPTFKGPLNKRSCTDVICLGLFLVFVGAWIFVGYYVGDCRCSVLGFTQGDPSRLLLPTDSQGRKCGLDTDVIDKPYLFFFDLTRCIRSNVVLNGCPTPQVCVKSCPEQNFIYSNLSSLETIRQDIICKTSINVSSILTVDEFTGHVDREDCARYYLSSKAAPQCSSTEPLRNHPVFGVIIHSYLKAESVKDVWKSSAPNEASLIPKPPTTRGPDSADAHGQFL